MRSKPIADMAAVSDLLGLRNDFLHGSNDRGAKALSGPGGFCSARPIRFWQSISQRNAIQHAIILLILHRTGDDTDDDQDDVPQQYWPDQIAIDRGGEEDLDDDARERAGDDTADGQLVGDLVGTHEGYCSRCRRSAGDEAG